MRSTLITSLLLLSVFLTACGGKEETAETTETIETESTYVELAGTAWDSHENEISFTFYEDGTGAQTDAWDSIDYSYTWDGTDLMISTDWITIEGNLDENGDLVLDGMTLTRTDTPTYAPGMYAEGNEAELEGDWIHNTGYIVLHFDGVDTVSFQRTDAPVGEAGAGAGTYTYDGEALTITLMDENDELMDYEGYIDSDGDIIINIWGEEGYYSPGDSSGHADASDGSDVNQELLSELVGEWTSASNEDVIRFSSDGAVTYSFGINSGYAYPYIYDGYNVEFSDYTGYIDEDGDLVISGIDDYFIHTDTTDYVDENSAGAVFYDWEINYYGDEEEGSLLDGRFYDNDTEELCLVFEDGAYGLFQYDYWIDDGYYSIEEDRIIMDNDDEIKTAIWDQEQDIITIEGLEGSFYPVERSSYYGS